MMFKKILFLLTILKVNSVCSSRILAVFPNSNPSHHNFFKPIVSALIDRGHQLVVITGISGYKNDENAEFVTEIDIQNLSKKAWADTMKDITVDNSLYNQRKKAAGISYIVAEKILNVPEIQELLNDKDQKFDMIIVECYQRPFYYLSLKFKAALVLISSVGPMLGEYVGISDHWILYTDMMRRKYNNLTIWDNVLDIYNNIKIVQLRNEQDEWIKSMVEKIDGHAPNMKVLYDSVDLMIVNEHKTWDFNRPVPLSMVYLYGTLIKPRSEISKDITAFIDSSPNGVIYLSFGTSVSECQLPQDKLQIMLKVFSELPYNVLWKWGDDLPGKPQNVLVRKWFDQANILKHPKIKLFITQGGVQSIEESIDAAVPMLGLPIVFDQLGNVDKMVRFGFGKKLDIFTMTEDEFRYAVNTLIDNKSYRKNVEKIRKLFLDQPQKPLERAVWCIETILRHGGRHLRSPAANLPWTEYYEVDLFLSILTVLLVLIVTVIMLVSRLQKFIYEVFRTDKVKSY